MTKLHQRFGIPQEGFFEHNVEYFYMANPGDLADTVKQQADIVRVVGDYVKLKKSGAQNFTGLCPFHQEKTPSFSVHATRQFFHCFGCGVSGDVFTFVQKLENITFPEAIRLVAQKLDIKLPKMDYSSPHEAQEARQRGQLIDMHERACLFFEDQLRRPEAAHAREYLASRGLKDDVVRTFRLGYAPDSGFVLRDRLKADFNEELQRASGLFSWKSETDAATMYSRFRNRIVFPIANEQGKTIAFTGRTLSTDEKAGPKYLNSPETPIYSKSRVLYNLDKAKDAIRKLEYAIIVEGQMDCIAVYSAGFRNVIASSGTAFTETQARLLARFSKNLVVNFDPDTAGATATDRSLGMLVQEEFNLKILRLEEGFDPDLFIRRVGAAAYGKALTQAVKYFDYLISRAMAMFPVRSPEGKVKAVNYLLPHIQRVPSRIIREGLADDIGQKLGISSQVLRQELRTAATRRSSAAVRTTPDFQVTPSEKVLVRAASTALAAEAGMRQTAMEALASESLHLGLTTESLLDALLGNAEKFADPLQLPLSDSDRQLLMRIVMQGDEPLSPELLEGALEALRHRSWLVQRDRDIKQGISEAERRNDVNMLVRLKQEKLELDRKLAAAQG
ncbi:MAG TPA: DNA primase [Candidatus Angelobacter sp.]|nr:DNA primase [Candidatus Angelobacter sp.]